MQLPGSGPVSGAMGLTNTPLGTPEELGKAELSLRIVSCCAPPSPGVRGCDQYHRCIFRYTNNGGFRDHGPKNIGYYHRSHDGHPAERELLCHMFMTHLFHRMEAGHIDRAAQRPGEIIEVIAQEGEMIHEQVIVDENVDVPNAKPRWVKKSMAHPVSHFLRPLERKSVASDATIEKRRKDREDARTEWSEGLPAAQRPRIEPSEPEEVLDMDEVAAVVSSPAPAKVSQAVPARRKPHGE